MASNVAAPKFVCDRTPEYPVAVKGRSALAVAYRLLAAETVNRFGVAENA
jgi:hypothetical protein